MASLAASSSCCCSFPTSRSPMAPSLFPAARLPIPPPRLLEPLHSSRRPTKGDAVAIPDRRPWRKLRGLAGDLDYGTDEDEEDEDEDEDEEDRSLDLLVGFLHNMFRKVSRRARGAVRSVLPVPIPARLVRFAVNGVLLLAFLWILKAFLEVVCTIGSMVFLSILFLRGIWFGFEYLQETRWNSRSKFDDDDDAWSGAQPAT